MAEDKKLKKNKRKTNKVEEKLNIDKKKKVPANPIPEKQYFRFKDKLIEISKENSERNLMIFQIGVATGYRIGDIVDLTIGNIKDAIEDEKFTIQEKKQYRSWESYKKLRIRKQEKGEILPDRKRPNPMDTIIKSNLKKLLEEYCKSKKRSEYAFPSNKYKDRHITSKTYSEILTKVGTSLKIKHISGHSLRKTYAHRLWDDTHNLEFVRKNLGHKSIVTTQCYLGLDSIMIEDAATIADSKI